MLRNVSKNSKERRRHLQCILIGYITCFKSLIFAYCLLFCPTRLYAMNSCEACSPDSICIAEQRNRALYAGYNSIEINVCNWWLTSASSAAYSFQFSLSNAITCDTMNVLTPVVDSIVAKSECPEGGDNMPCKLGVIFRYHFDWAIAIQARGKANVLLAAVVGPKAVNGAVPVGTFFPTAITPSISPLDDLISVCSSRIAMMGTHFSQTPSCNTVQLCSVASDAKECSDLIHNGFNVSSVVCKGEHCSGDIVLRDHFACMLSNNEKKNAILAALWVAGSNAGKAVIGSLAPQSAEIIAVRGAYIGSSKLIVKTKDSCATEKFTLSRIQGTRLEPVHLINVMTGTSTGETGITLPDAFDGQEEYQLDTSQCEVKSAAPYKFRVRKSKDEEAVEDSGDTTLRPSTTKLSTQSSGTSSSGWIIGLIVISIAVAGFGADWWYHRRKYFWGNSEAPTSAMPYSSDSTL